MADTMVGKALRVVAHPDHSRVLENVGFVAGLLYAGAYVLGVETLPSVLYSLGRSTAAPVSHGFPWGTALICALCIAPKTVGRATSGKLWAALAGKFGA